MNFLSHIAGLTKRKPDIINKVKEVAERSKTVEGLEKEMEKSSSSLVSSMREGKINSSEFFRAISDQLLIGSLAAVHLGSKGSKPDQTVEAEFPAAVMRLQPLSQFYVDFLHFQKSEASSSDEDFEEESWGGVTWDPDAEYFGVEGDFVSEGDDPSSPPASWGGVAERVKRYLVTPVYGWYNRGEMRKNSRLGYSEMRRLTRKDKRVCPDCIDYEQRGWQPIGSLPSPGVECRCYDRCRCAIEYR